jgi:hypothetical protein
VAAWIFVVLGQSTLNATPGTSGVPDLAVRLTSAITDPDLYLPYLAAAACCAAFVYYATRPQRGIQ